MCLLSGATTFRSNCSSYTNIDSLTTTLSHNILQQTKREGEEIYQALPVFIERETNFLVLQVGRPQIRSHIIKGGNTFIETCVCCAECYICEVQKDK